MKVFFHIVPVFLALLPVLFAAWEKAWSAHGTTSPHLLVCALIAFVGTFLLPQAHKDESRLHAMKRVVRLVIGDPFVYLGAAFLLLLVIPLYNQGLCPACDARAIAAGASAQPPYAYLPFCVNPDEHGSLLRWFTAAFATAFAFRHGLVGIGRRIGYEALVWNGALLAAYGFVLLPLGKVDSSYSFSVFGYPNQGGSFFVLSLALSLGLWGYRIMRASRPEREADPVSHPLLARHYPAIPAALTFFASVATLSRAAMLFALSLAGVFFVYVFVASIAGKRRVHRVKGLSGILILISVLLSVVLYAPPVVQKEFATLTTRGITDRAAGKGQYHERVASAIMRDYPFFGIGGWGYRHFCRQYMDKKELRGLQVTGGANVHNDYLQFVAEHGLVGFALLAIAFILLLRSVWRRWWLQYGYYRFSPTERTPVSPQLIYAVEPTVFFAVLGIVAVLLHALGDCPLRSPVVVITLFAVPVATLGFFRAPEKK